MKKTKKNCSTGGDLLGSLNTINPLVGVGINALMNTAQKYMEEARNRNMVVSGTPGNFNNGGPIDSLYQPVITNPITTNVTPTTQPLLPTAAGLVNPTAGLVNPNIGLNTPGANWGNSKSKSKERFRERFTGGALPISSDSVQIKGSPNTVDGNSFPQIQANLDHNEVLKNNFVFSNRLKDDLTSSPFAKLALLIEKGTASAEKTLKTNPSDQFAKNAIRLNNQNLENVAKRQEQKAQSLGLRDNSRGYQNGGPLDTIPPSPNFAWYPPIPSYPNTSNLGWVSPAPAFDYVTQNNRSYAAAENVSNNTVVPATPAFSARRLAPPYTPKDNVYNNTTVPASPAFDPSKINNVSKPNNADYISRLEKELADFNASRNKKKPTAPKTASKQPNLRNAQAEYEARTSFSMNPDQAKYEYGVEPLAPLNMLSRNMMVLGPGEMNVSAPVQVQSTNPTSITPKQLEALKNVSTTTTKPKSNRGLMLGDFLQMSEVLSKFGQLAGGSEVERPYYDNTRITKNSYDPSQALNQNTRSYSTAIRNLDSQSINARRALAGSLLGSKMNADAQTLTQYQQMNQAANTDYENRTSNQRRFNIGQSLQTNDMNARNRAAYKEAVDVAFNSLGNFGQALNRKQTAQDQLGILATIYPDVYARIINSMYNGNQ